MRKSVVLVALTLALVQAPAKAGGAVQIAASPNPVGVGQRVVHTVTTSVFGRLEVWVSAKGFAQPGIGTLPPGSWSFECCPSQTVGTPAWHYRSTNPWPVGSFRFGAGAIRTGSYLSTAAVGVAFGSIWVRVV
jgi:hypothetical protein